MVNINFTIKIVEQSKCTNIKSAVANSIKFIDGGGSHGLTSCDLCCYIIDQNEQTYLIEFPRAV